MKLKLFSLPSVQGNCFIDYRHLVMPVPVSARSKVWLYGRSLVRIVGSNPARVHECLPRVSVVCVDKYRSCDEPIIRPEVFYRLRSVLMRSRNLTEEGLGPLGLSSNKKTYMYTP
jgi:hypothetical protein